MDDQIQAAYKELDHYLQNSVETEIKIPSISPFTTYLSTHLADEIQNLTDRHDVSMSLDKEGKKNKIRFFLKKKAFLSVSLFVSL